jgi:quinoprotein glucose dehydrogenase
MKSFCLLLVFIFTLITSCKTDVKKSYDDWKIYGGSKEASHYSSLTEIDTNNVSQLKVAWIYHTADVDTSDH